MTPLPLCLDSTGPCLFAAAFAAVLAAPLSAQVETITTIVDTDDFVPGTTTNWTSFSTPANDQGRVAFLGLVSGGNDLDSLLRAPSTGGPVTVIADETTPIPGFPGEDFGTLTPHGLFADTVVFSGGDFINNPTGLYAGEGGPTRLIIDQRLGDPFRPRFPDTDGSWIAFRADGEGQEPIYATRFDGSVISIADSGDPAPGGGTFFSFQPPAMAAGQVVFPAIADSQFGVFHYSLATGQLDLVANEETQRPGMATSGSTGFFTFLDDADTDGEDVVFFGQDGTPGFGGQAGLYRRALAGGTIEPVVELTTPVPGDSGAFTFFNFPSLDGEVVAFRGTVDGVQDVLFFADGSGVHRIVGVGETLDGRTVATLTLAQQGLFGDELAFLATFDDGAAGVYVARLSVDLPARATARDGLGLVSLCYSTSEAPVLGTTWDATVDVSAHPGATGTVLVGFAQPLLGLVTPLGELLVDPTSGFVVSSSAAPSGGTATHALAVPGDPALVGFRLSTQAAILGGGVELCNALDLQLGS